MPPFDTLRWRLWRLRASPGLELWRAVKSLSQRTSSGPQPVPVLFVAGQQRSGTYKLMEVLDRHRETRVYHESDPRAFDRYELRDDETIDALRARCRARLMVVKCLCESHDLDRLLARFAPARAIWAFRHYGDVGNSMARRFSSTAQVMREIRDDPAAGGWRARGMSEQTHAVLKETLPDGVNEFTAAVAQWYMRNVLLFENGLIGDQRVHLVNYDDLVTDPTARIERLARFAGIEAQPRMMRRMHPRSLRKHSLPILPKRLETVCEALWRELCAADTRARRADSS